MTPAFSNMAANACACYLQLSFWWYRLQYLFDPLRRWAWLTEISTTGMPLLTLTNFQMFQRFQEPTENNQLTIK